MAYTNIDDPSAYFQTATYTGNGNATNAITNDGNSDLQPDFVWVKRREGASDHVLQDSSRGFTATTKLASSSTQRENDTNSGGSFGITDPQWGYISSASSDGFNANVGTGTGDQVNKTSSTYVAWQWKANGGTTSSKSSGTVAGNVTTPCVQQVNTDAGFSIITYTASTSYAGTETHLEHGLGVGPKFLIVKRRDTSSNWAIYHAEHGGSPNAGYGYLLLNSTAATAQSSPTNKYWLNTPAESNATLLAFGSGDDTGANGGEYVCYAFAEKQGYSKFGGYVGNGNDNGPFIYTGFKPAFVLTKGTHVSQWRLYDSARSPNNVNINRLFPYTNVAEATDTDAGIDMLSNGFKIRGSGGDYNASGQAYIYIAFAENPFVTSTGIPTTAR